MSSEHRIVKYGRWLWVIIEPTRQLFMRTEDNGLLTFKRKEDALNYCKDNNLEVSEEYRQ